jgi:glutathione synthase/RimK-type ligase-like ATP-grasp enzyme
MIFLWGLEQDAPMKMVMNELQKSAVDFVFLTIVKFSLRILITKAPKKPAFIVTLRVEEKVFDLTKMKVAYIRPYNFHDFEEMENKTNDDPVAVKAAGFEMQLLAYLDTSDAVVINKSDGSATNGSKPLQLAVIKQVGLKIPETFISNDNEAVQKFLHTNKEAVYKSISSVRSIVQKISDTHLEYLNDVSWCPTLFQKMIDGINYRAHVIGDNIYTVRIQSDKLDYRYGNTAMVAEELPAEVAEKCINSIQY